MLVAINEHEGPDFWFVVTENADENSALLEVSEETAERWANSILDFMQTQAEIENEMFEQVKEFP